MRNAAPCILVKEVCNFADSDKIKRWQRYAAATSAAVTKAILEGWVGGGSSSGGSHADNDDGRVGPNHETGHNQNTRWRKYLCLVDKYRLGAWCPASRRKTTKKDGYETFPARGDDYSLGEQYQASLIRQERGDNFLLRP
ncbi:hypothetical protein PpBr36_03493 [Pyricularia pennisetigena]|uniref:hypothetical protein n=1 Tax=Pyricularia pennisetigena TaxID=1578925 RepID=UPI00114F05AF|nr:hypothetical protein PpBr36_03493 [Pyricularia pennisetigena]TLS31013.1 hypothetical protein PpBr36_03493 [Pyricularia pennisetigena]